MVFWLILKGFFGFLNSNYHLGEMNSLYLLLEQQFSAVTHTNLGTMKSLFQYFYPTSFRKE